MEKRKWILCPRCGNTIGEYSEELEKQRKEENFKSYCNSCFTAVTPLYI